MSGALHVVTKAPKDVTNFAVTPDLFQMVDLPSEANDYLGEFARVEGGVLLSLRVPVFHEGEILLLGDDGREVGGQGRKPDKWGVEIQQVNSLEEAEALVRSLSAAPAAPKRLPGEEVTP